ncbi:MAG: DNA methylase N-4/N-6 protein [candidate division Zixibacteria bacterium RBG-1]|nr:MAG: DNA methylase N-4/N-6 protein [candidate division Zixibacteria bacterium RBG-1]OGC84001.1 MAG: DNA methylase [candidate division Zixibacteria bacterium RBG_19FT_COMBO_42_43]
MIADNYKIIKVRNNGTQHGIDKIEQVFSLFPKEDIFLESSRKGLVIYLHQLNFTDFEKNFKTLSDTSDKRISELLNSILNNIKKIKSYGLKGNKRLYVGYNKERKVKGRKEKEKERGIYYYTKGNNFSKKNNEVPKQFINKIIPGNSEEVLKELPDNCIDLIFTSPPYNFGLSYDNHKDGTNWEEYFDKLFSILKESIRVLKYAGRIIVNVQPLFSDYIPIHHIISDFFMKQKLIWKGEIIWDKHNWNCKYTAWGSWKSPSSPYLKYTWEFLEVFCKGDLKKPGLKENIDISDEEFKKYVIGKWDVAPARNMKEYGHPAMFPESLVERVLKLFSYKEDVILDPFNGVGTTTAVAKRLSRKYIGVDISKEYCAKAESRLKKTVVNTTLF